MFLFRYFSDGSIDFQFRSDQAVAGYVHIAYRSEMQIIFCHAHHLVQIDPDRVKIQWPMNVTEWKVIGKHTDIFRDAVSARVKIALILL